MPNRRKPTELLMAQGAYAKNPNRLASRLDTAMGVGELGDPPSNLNEQERVAWNVLKSELQGGVAFKSDRRAFALLCRLDVMLGTSKVSASMITQYVKLLGLFGLTPSDRSRVKVVPKPTPKDDEESFASLRRVR